MPYVVMPYVVMACSHGQCSYGLGAAVGAVAVDLAGLDKSLKALESNVLRGRTAIY